MDKKLDNWWETVTYAGAKKCIRENIQSLARDYIAIGYYLRRVRDQAQFLEDGYSSVHEFAFAEFGMRKSTVNHCIRINAEFSEGGNSPVVDARYKEFGKTQLQELLYVPEEKRNEVTPDMTVAEIREIHKPERLDDEPKEKEARRLDTEPEEREVQRLDDEPEKYGKSGQEKSGKDSRKENLSAESKTDSARKAPEPLHFTAGPVTVNNSYGATYSEIIERYLDTEYQSDSKECTVYIGWRMYKVLKRPKVTAFYDDIGGFMFDVENERLEQEYQALQNGKDVGTFPEDIPNPEPDVVDAEYQEEPMEITVQDLLCQKQRELDEWVEAIGDDDCTAVPGIIELGIIVRALELLAGQEGSQEEPETEREIRENVSGLDVEEIMAAVAKARGVGKSALDNIRICVEQLFMKDDTSMEPDGQDTEVQGEMAGVREQPPLPALKNNEQRKEWLRKYQEWGLWYEDGNIGAKYYRYCFENGAELIVEEYQGHSEYAGDYTDSYFHLVGGPEASEKNAIPKWSRHEKYNKYPNSESELVEFLKFTQKEAGKHVS